MTRCDAWPSGSSRPCGGEMRLVETVTAGDESYRRWRCELCGSTRSQRVITSPRVPRMGGAVEVETRSGRARTRLGVFLDAVDRIEERAEEHADHR